MFKKKLLEKYPWLNLFFKFNYGLLPKKEDSRDYILGASPIQKTVIRPDGQWNEFLPAEERQAGRLTDTMACTSFGLLNCLETLAKAQFGVSWNKSDRYLAKMSRTRKNGNTMRSVLDTTRKNFGTLKEKHWGWDRNTFNWDNYYKTVPRDIQEIGKAWLKEYELQYESVYNNKNLLMEALKYSPLYVGGYSWRKKGNLYYSMNFRANHCFSIVGYIENSHWIIFDSYPPFVKHLDWNYDFKYVKSIYLTKKSLQYNQKEINKLIARGYNYIQRPLANGEFYQLTNKGLKYLTAEQARDLGIKKLDEAGKLIGINEGLYAQLLR